MKEALSPWMWTDRPGVGLQIEAVIPQKTPCAEFTMTQGLQPVLQVVGYEPWIQFEPAQWTEMQKDNVKLMAGAKLMWDFISILAEGGQEQQLAKAIINQIENSEAGKPITWPKRTD